MFGRLFVGLAVLYWIGWKLIRADLIPDMLATRATAGPGRRSLFDRWTRGLRRLAPGAPRRRRIASTGWPRSTWCCTRSCSPWWRSTGSWRSSRTGSRNLLGGFYFMGSFLGAHMLLALMCIYGASQLGIGDLVSPKQRHDLGKLCFGFTVFWTYLMWAQFLVIWYGNLPEETGFVFARLWGDWLPVGRGGADRHVHHPVLRTARRGAEEDPGDAGVLRAGEPGVALARAVPAGDAVGDARCPARCSAFPRPARRSCSWVCSCCATRSSPARSRWSRPGWRRSRWTGSGGTPWWPAEFEHEESPQGLRAAGADRAAGKAAAEQALSL